MKYLNLAVLVVASFITTSSVFAQDKKTELALNI